MKANETKTDGNEAIEVNVGGIVARIRRREKNGYESFIVDYRVNLQRKLIERSTLAAAKEAAKEALGKIAAGETAVAGMNNADAHLFIRATRNLAGAPVALDIAAHKIAECYAILGGAADPVEACREWITRRNVKLPEILIPAACEKVQAQALADGKSFARRHELQVILGRFAAAFNCAAATVTASAVSGWLSGLKIADGSPASERSKRNHKDVVAHLNRWLVLHGFLTRGTNWLDGVQKYSKRKQGDVTIYTPAELAKLFTAASATPTRSKWMIAFLAISAFSTIRHTELKRLDWKNVELSDKPGESFITIAPEAGTKSAGRRRLIPICDTLAAWLKNFRQAAGPVVPVRDSYTLLSRLITAAGVEVRANALRHSSITYRVAQTGDIARTADESGNSVAMIQAHYLRRVKPAQAAEWFAILPPAKANGKKTSAPIIPPMNIPARSVKPATANN